MTSLPTKDLDGLLEEYERTEDLQREREEREAEDGRDPEFTYPCPLKDWLA